MTYIRTTRRFRLGRAFLIVGAMLIAFIFSEIYIYSQTVNLKHDILSLGETIEELRLKNAELKNDLYRLTDRENLEKLARSRGLVQDNNPKWVFASQY